MIFFKGYNNDNNHDDDYDDNDVDLFESFSWAKMIKIMLLLIRFLALFFCPVNRRRVWFLFLLV